MHVEVVRKMFHNGYDNMLVSLLKTLEADAGLSNTWNLKTKY